MGFINKNKAGKLNFLYVQERYRNLGVGSKIFQKACALMFKYGCTKISWDALPLSSYKEDELKSLEKFYLKNGAQVDSHEDMYVRMSITEEQFRKTL